MKVMTIRLSNDPETSKKIDFDSKTKSQGNKIMDLNELQDEKWTS